MYMCMYYYMYSHMSVPWLDNPRYKSQLAHY